MGRCRRALRLNMVRVELYQTSRVKCRVHEPERHSQRASDYLKDALRDSIYFVGTRKSTRRVNESRRSKMRRRSKAIGCLEVHVLHLYRPSYSSHAMHKRCQ